jgi:hypothetical protein
LTLSFEKRLSQTIENQGAISSAICLSLIAHFLVIWVSSTFEYPRFIETIEQNGKQTSFAIRVRPSRGEAEKLGPLEDSSIPLKPKELPTPTTQEQAISIESETTTIEPPSTPTMTSSPIGYYKSTLWGPRFVNTTPIILKKTTQFISQVEQELAKANFSGKCVIYIGPSDYLALMLCSGDQAQVMKIASILKDHFRITPELVNYWRCIEISNQSAYIKETCDTR